MLCSAYEIVLADWQSIDVKFACKGLLIQSCRRIPRGSDASSGWGHPRLSLADSLPKQKTDSSVPKRTPGFRLRDIV